MKTTCSLIAGLILMLSAYSALAENVDMLQVPATAMPYGNNGEAAISAGDEAGNADYQNDVLSNPVISDPARANAITNGGGNTAVIVQEGKSNTSAVIQKGKNNHASQTQNGVDNNLRVEQYGQNNNSEEQQTGERNHKVKIQNGNQTDLMIEQTSPETDNKP